MIYVQYVPSIPNLSIDYSPKSLFFRTPSWNLSLVPGESLLSKQHL